MHGFNHGAPVVRTLFLPLSLLLPAAVAGAGAAEIGLSFPGIAEDTLPVDTAGVLPPDSTGAAGPTRFAQFTNGAFAAYDKSDGSRTALVSAADFWRNAGVSDVILSAGVARPRLIYDHAASRWFALQRTGHDVDNRILLAVSAGTDPDPSAGNWRAVVIPGNAAAAGGGAEQPTTYRFVDFPTLGLDADGLYVATVNYGSSAGGADNSTSLFSVPKADLTAAAGPTPANLTAFYGSTDNFNSFGYVLQPSVNVAGDAADGRAPVFAVNYEMPGAVNRTDVLGAAGPDARLSATSVIAVEETDFPPAPRQPDGTGGGSDAGGLTPFDDRIGSTVYRVGDRVYLAHTIGVPAGSAERSAVRWTVLRVDGETTEVVQEGTIEDQSFDFFTPSIAANADGDVVIGYNRSGPGPGGEINAYFSAGVTSAADGAITFGDPQQASFSTVTSYHNAQDPDAWGEYGSVSPDPADPSVFWLVQPVPLDGDTWGTQVVQIVVPEPAGAAGAVLLGAAAAALTPAGRRRRRHRGSTR